MKAHQCILLSNRKRIGGSRQFKIGWRRRGMEASMGGFQAVSRYCSIDLVCVSRIHDAFILVAARLISPVPGGGGGAVNQKDQKKGN